MDKFSRNRGNLCAIYIIGIGGWTPLLKIVLLTHIQQLVYNWVTSKNNWSTEKRASTDEDHILLWNNIYSRFVQSAGTDAHK